MRNVRIAWLQWAMGALCFVAGALMLLTPHQFSVSAFQMLRPYLLELGILLLVAGGALIGVTALEVRGAWAAGAHVLASAGLLALALGNAADGGWIGAALAAIWALGTAGAPFLPGVRRPDTGSDPVDAFVVLAGVAAAAGGLAMLLFPVQFDDGVYRVGGWVRPYAPWLGAALLGSGLWLGWTRLRTSTRTVRSVASLASAAAHLAVGVVMAAPSGIWLAVAYFAGFGVLVGLLPWLEWRRPVDASSLRTRFAFALAATAAVPLIAAVVIGAGIEERSERTKTLARNQVVAERLADALEDHIGHNVTLLRTLEHYLLSAEADTTSLEPPLRALEGVRGDALGFVWYDETGRPVAASDSRYLSLGGNLAGIVDLGDDVDSLVDVVMTPLEERPVILVSVPVRDGARRLIGSLSVLLNSTPIAAHLIQERALVGEVRSLHDRTGNVVLETDRELPGISGAQFPRFPRAILQQRAVDSGYLEYVADGEEWLAGYGRVERLGWSIVIQRRAGDVLAESHRLRELTVVALLFLIAGGTAVGSFTSGQLVAPLRVLAKSVERLAAGDVGVTVPASEVSEIRLLATSVGNLAHRLQERTAERDRVEVALRESEERFRGLLESAPEAIVIADSQRRIVLVNSQTERLFGYDRTELVGRSLELLLPERSRAEFTTGFGRFLAEPVFRPMGSLPRMVGLRKDGSEFPSEVGASFEARDHEVFVIAVVRDITDRERADSDLRLAKEEAERASRAKSEFLSRVSHELRTPLNAVLGFAQLLEMDPLGAGQRESVDQILRGGRHLLELVNEVLDIARIESGQLSVSRETVRLAVAVAQSMDLVRPLASQRRVQITCGVTPTCPIAVQADLQRLKQVLLNLLSNAVKFNQEGGSVEICCSPAEGDAVRIEIRDTGPGIPPEKIDRLFSPFERLGAEQSNIDGTGLGLALSKRLVEAMRGTIGVDSAVGRGSTFWVELRRAEDTDVSADVVTELVPEPTQGPQRARTVLYVEDNPSNLDLVERIFQRRPGVQLLTAMQGRMALALAREHKPDLVLLDLHLPDASGEVVLRELRADPGTHRIPVVVISADATAGQIQRLLSLGASDYLTKPLEVRRFLEVVDATLAHAKRGPDDG